MQEDIKSTIYIINLTYFVYKNLTFYRSVFNDLEKVIDHWNWLIFFFATKSGHVPDWRDEHFLTPIGDLLDTACIFFVTKWGHFDPRFAIFFFSQNNICQCISVICQIEASFSNQLYQ